MGYFGNGFVLQEAPSSEALESLPSTLGVVAFRHKTKPVWLLDIWSCTRGEHWHFTDEIRDDPAAPAAAGAEQQLRRLAEIRSRIANGILEGVNGEPALNIASFLSARLATPLFYFAADDESTDMAAILSGGRIVDFSARVGSCRVRLEGERFVVQPCTWDEDPEEVPAAGVISSLRSLDGVIVTDTVTVTEGERLYGNAVALWPREAGDPVEMLGVGTWDPFEHVERDYVRVFERSCPSVRRREPQPKDPRTMDLHQEIPSLRPVRTVFRWLVYLLGAFVIGLVLLVAGAFVVELLK